MPKIRKTKGPFTVWDTGFSFVVAPSEPSVHPHINAAVQMEAVKRFPVGNASLRQIDKLLKKAWDYCNKLNEGSK